MPGAEGVPPNPQQVKELRERALAKITEIGPDQFSNVDIDKLKTSDHYLIRFWLHVFDLPGDQMDESINMMIETFKWRKTFGVESISEDTTNNSFFEKGVLFSRNRDKDGKKLMVFTVGKHVKGVEKMDEMKRFFIYYLERLEREEKGDEITIVFDCRNAGLKNMDMEFIQFIIGVFKDYYPTMLNYILVFEMPWVLNAAWKIIKAWLPAAAVKKIKFLTKSNMSEYVDDSNRFEFWGGSDPWEYEFVPEVRHHLAPTAIPHTLNGNSHVETLEDSMKLDDASRRKTVTFAELAVSPSNDSISSFVANGPDILRLNPSQEVVFTSTQSGELIAKVQVTNICDKTVGFKIKTTSPEKYRVRPSSGVLTQGKSSNVEIHLSGQSPPGSLVRDKFLVTVVFVDDPDISVAKLQELLKKSKPDGQYRLRCQMSTDGNTVLTSLPVNYGSAVNSIAHEKLQNSQNLDDPAKQMASLIKKINHLTEKQEELENQLSVSSKIQMILLLLTIIILIVLWIYLPSSQILESLNSAGVRPAVPTAQPSSDPRIVEL